MDLDLADWNPDLAEAVRALVDVVRREASVDLETVSKLLITPESDAIVSRLRAQLGALETVERHCGPRPIRRPIQRRRPREG